MALNKTSDIFTWSDISRISSIAKGSSYDKGSKIMYDLSVMKTALLHAGHYLRELRLDYISDCVTLELESLAYDKKLLFKLGQSDNSCVIIVKDRTTGHRYLDTIIPSHIGMGYIISDILDKWFELCSHITENDINIIVKNNTVQNNSVEDRVNKYYKQAVKGEIGLKKETAACAKYLLRVLNVYKHKIKVDLINGDTELRLILDNRYELVFRYSQTYKYRNYIVYKDLSNQSRAIISGSDAEIVKAITEKIK